MMTPKGTKPNTQHRTTRGTFDTYEDALRGRSRFLLGNESEGTVVTIMRKRDHFTLRIDSKPKEVK
jgi:hypothetical protein